MIDWKHIIQDYIVKHFNQMQKTTQPLRHHFGISYFSYHRIDHKGKYTVLVDRPDWAEHYVSEQIFLHDPYLGHPSSYQSGIYLIDSQGSEGYKTQVLKAGKKILDMDLGVILIEKNEEAVEFFGFSSNKKNSSLESVYLNHPELLRSFTVHFKTTFHSILAQMSDSGIQLSQLKKQKLLYSSFLPPPISSSKRISYYKDLGMDEMIIKCEKLAPREKQCIKFLLQNLSAKETAFLLGLSTRTVEYYFENIKNKWDCSTKQEILRLAKKLECMRIL